MNGYTTIGITPELAAMMDKDWSEPVQVRARRGANGALELEFREPIKKASGAPGPVYPSGFRGLPEAVSREQKGRPRATDH